MTKHIVYVLTGAAAICAFVAVMRFVPWLIVVPVAAAIAYFVGLGIVENIQARRRK